ncbi:MAG: ABC transporter substrate-binding protein [Desulfobacteraceae bacterium]|nr:ABC transporter substrate-binding protein [Desulfobacteraceae bacterium]
MAFKLKCICACLLVMVLLLPAMVTAAHHTIAMITWRGETIAEKGFMDELERSGVDISLDKYHANQDKDRLQQIITGIEEKPVDLIYVFGTTSTKAVLKRIKIIPVVFNIVSRPVGSGIIASWESSENNATGASNKVSVMNQLRALKKVVAFKRLGIIYNPDEQNSVLQRNTVKRLENRLGFSLREYHIRNESDIEQNLPSMKDSVDAVFLPADSMIKSLGQKIMVTINGLKIPSLSTVGSMVPEDNVLLGFVPKYYELGRLAAQKALQILSGKKPSDIPSSVLDHYNIYVNMKTAQKINIQIPMSILVMSNQIVR